MTSSVERQGRADRNVRFGHTLVDVAPDHRVAVRLRRELERDRALGLEFDQVFDDEVDHCLSAMPRAQRDQWRIAFWSQREIWRSAYDGTGDTITQLRPELLAEPDPF